MCKRELSSGELFVIILILTATACTAVVSGSHVYHIQRLAHSGIVVRGEGYVAWLQHTRPVRPAEVVVSGMTHILHWDGQGRVPGVGDHIVLYKRSGVDDFREYYRVGAVHSFQPGRAPSEGRGS